MMWECGGCGRLFEKDAVDAKWMHALVKHGGVEAVTFHARADFELPSSGGGVVRE